MLDLLFCTQVIATVMSSVLQTAVVKIDQRWSVWLLSFESALDSPSWSQFQLRSSHKLCLYSWWMNLDGHKKVCICCRDRVLHEAQWRLISRMRTWGGTLHTERDRKRVLEFLQERQVWTLAKFVSRSSFYWFWNCKVEILKCSEWMCREKMRDGCRRDTGRGDMIAEGENSRVLPNTRSSTEALPGLHLDICTAAPNPVNTHPQMAQNESKLSYKEPVLPLRLVLCCTLSSLSCFNLADATPWGLLWNWNLAVQQVCSNSRNMTIWLRCSRWARAKSMMISACFWLWLSDHLTFPGIHEWEIIMLMNISVFAW